MKTWVAQTDWLGIEVRFWANFLSLSAELWVNSVKVDEFRVGPIRKTCSFIVPCLAAWVVCEGIGQRYRVEVFFARRFPFQYHCQIDVNGQMVGGDWDVELSQIERYDFANMSDSQLHFVWFRSYLPSLWTALPLIIFLRWSVQCVYPVKADFFIIYFPVIFVWFVPLLAFREHCIAQVLSADVRKKNLETKRV